jgi:hypothetical protein
MVSDLRMIFNERNNAMVTQDIKKGWNWLLSLSDEEWCKAINRFFESTGSVRRIPYSFLFPRYRQVRIDIERQYETELSTWFCEVSPVPPEVVECQEY